MFRSPLIGLGLLTVAVVAGVVALGSSSSSADENSSTGSDLPPPSAPPPQSNPGRTTNPPTKARPKSAAETAVSTPPTWGWGASGILGIADTLAAGAQAKRSDSAAQKATGQSSNTGTIRRGGLV